MVWIKILIFKDLFLNEVMFFLIGFEKRGVPQGAFPAPLHQEVIMKGHMGPL